MRFVWAGTALLVVSVSMGAQVKAEPQEATPVSMPVDRFDDSYRIYSALMPLGETGGRDWPHEQFLVEDVSVVAVPAGEPCFAQPTNAMQTGNNPHGAITAGEGRQQELAEALDDFDKHCHERIRFQPGAWRATVPVQLLNADETKQFMATRFGGPGGTKASSEAAAKFKGAPAVYSFSQVYFNAHHTLAIVYATHWCGSLCGQGFWNVFELRNGKWHSLPWTSSGWIS